MKSHCSQAESTASRLAFGCLSGPSQSCLINCCCCDRMVGRIFDELLTNVFLCCNWTTCCAPARLEFARSRLTVMIPEFNEANELQADDQHVIGADIRRLFADLPRTLVHIHSARSQLSDQKKRRAARLLGQRWLLLLYNSTDHTVVCSL